MQSEVIVIGGGLAGCEAAWQIAERGGRARLYEMRPRKMTPAHTSGTLAELVCSNSLGADDETKAPGVLKREMRALDSLIIAASTEATVPAGGALAVDRTVFANAVERRIQAHPRITVVREEVTALPTDPNAIVIVASGPLTSEPLAESIGRLGGSERLYFWDAIAPIVTLESVNFERAFRASRYGWKVAEGERLDRNADGSRKPESAPAGEEDLGDYINCPMTRDEYRAFVEALLAAQTAALREFERADDRYFEGCLPVEVMARRGPDALAWGPMRPVGLRDPRTNRRPYAVVQLRQDNVAGTLYNLVGFQTNLTWPEQDRVLRLIPGLEHAEFTRLGQMHRNTFINAPLLLDPTLRYNPRIAGASQSAQPLFFAGQITGVEGYAGNAATGLLAGLNAVRLLAGKAPVAPPPTTMLGALVHYVTGCDPRHFQPMKAAFGLFPPLAEPPRDKRQRAIAYSERARADYAAWMEGLD